MQTTKKLLSISIDIIIPTANQNNANPHNLCILPPLYPYGYSLLYAYCLFSLHEDRKLCVCFGFKISKIFILICKLIYNVRNHIYNS